MLSITTEMQAAFQALDNSYKLLSNLNCDKETILKDILNLEEVLKGLGEKAHSDAMCSTNKEYFDYAEQDFTLIQHDTGLQYTFKGHPFEFKGFCTTWRGGLRSLDRLFEKFGFKNCTVMYKGLVIKRC